MRAFTALRFLEDLAWERRLPTKADVVVRTPWGGKRSVQSIRARKDGTVVITTRARW